MPEENIEIPSSNKYPLPELKLYGEHQEKCTQCGSPEVEWMHQFCQECWERYTSTEWWTMIESASPAIYSGRIVDNPTTEI